MNTPIKEFRQDSPATTPSSAGKPMSSGLKERLKRCGRYHASPISTAKSPISTAKSPISTAKSPISTVKSPISATKSHLSTAKSRTKYLSERNSTSITSVKSHPECQERTPHSFVRPQSLMDSDFVTPKKGNFAKPISNKSANLFCGVANKSPNLCEIYRKNTAHESNSKRVQSEFINAKCGEVLDNVPSDINDASKHMYSESLSFEQCGSQRLNIGTSEIACRKYGADSEDLGPVGESEARERRDQLLVLIKEREETLRKLHLVKMYRDKSDIVRVTQLTEKWREACQRAVCDLHAHTDQSQSSISQLLEHLHIDPLLVHYDIEQETFY